MKEKLSKEEQTRIMPQSKERHAEYMQERRALAERIDGDKKLVLEGSQKGSQDGEVHGEGSQEYPAIIHALADPDKRAKLEKIHQSLKEFGVADKVFYGYPGLGGVPFDAVGGYLDATR